MPVKFTEKARSKEDGEVKLTENDVLNTNYLSSVDYIFKSSKIKRTMIENKKKFFWV